MNLGGELTFYKVLVSSRLPLQKDTGFQFTLIVYVAQLKLRPMKSTVSYVIHKFLRPLNHHVQNFAEEHVEHNLLHALNCLIDGLYFCIK